VALDRDSPVEQQERTGFAVEQQPGVVSDSLSELMATMRANQSGGLTPFSIAHANFCAGNMQLHPDQHASALRHEQLQSMQGKGTDRSLTTRCGIENTNPLPSATINIIAEMIRRLRIGCKQRSGDNMAWIEAGVRTAEDAGGVGQDKTLPARHLTLTR